MNRYWHVYPRNQIKASAAGDSVYVVSVPSEVNSCVATFVGKTLNHNRLRGLAGLEQDLSIFSHRHGIVFQDVSEKCIETLTVPDLPDSSNRHEIHCYNREVIIHARERLLAETSYPEEADALTFCLTKGLTNLLPGFESHPRFPVPLLNKSGGQGHILVVEDDECQLDFFHHFLMSLGYENILLAADGIEALPILQAHGQEIDLMLLNWNMPRMDGISLLKHLGPEYPHTVGVVMVSGYPDNSYIREFFKCGTDRILPIDYVPKPFLLEDLRLEVAVAMEYVRRRKMRANI